MITPINLTKSLACIICSVAIYRIWKGHTVIQKFDDNTSDEIWQLRIPKNDNYIECHIEWIDYPLKPKNKITRSLTI